MIPLEPKPNEHGNELDKYNTCLIILSINQTSYGQKFEVIEVFVLELPCGFRLEWGSRWMAYINKKDK